jgi:hypothetical protein
MYGVHAIDLTWRGQKVVLPDGSISFVQPAIEYFGVEIPLNDVIRFVSRSGTAELILARWFVEQQAAA